MTKLRPCPECQRHVRVTETECPFCASAIDAPEPARRPGSAMTRAAIFAGATLLSAPGCGDKTPDPKNPDPVEQQQADAAPPDQTIDDGVDKDGNVERQDAGPDRRDEDVKRDPDIDNMPPPDKPYGAPPNRDRAV